MANNNPPEFISDEELSGPALMPAPAVPARGSNQGVPSLSPMSAAPTPSPSQSTSPPEFIPDEHIAAQQPLLSRVLDHGIDAAKGLLHPFAPEQVDPKEQALRDAENTYYDQHKNDSFLESFSTRNNSPRMQALRDYQKQHENDPWTEKLRRFVFGDPNSPMKVVEGTPPLAIPVGAAVPAAGFGARAFDMVGKVPEAGLTAPQALTNVANFMGGSGKLNSAARIAASSGLGAANNPQDPVVGAIYGGVPAAAFEVASSPKLPGKVLGMSGEESVNYAKNPAQADALREMNANDPGDLNKMLENIGKDAIYGNKETGQPSLFDTVGKPLLKERGERLAGTNMSIKTSQLAGTEAEPELERIAAASGQTGKSTINVTGPQAERIKEILQNKVDESSGFEGYLKSKDPNYIAATDMQKGIEALHPRIPEINHGPSTPNLQENMDISRDARKIFDSNPAKILNNSESIGSTPVRTIQKYLDKHGGTNFSELGNSLQAGKAYQAGGKTHGLLGLGSFLTEPAARFGLRNNQTIAPFLRTAVPASYYTPYNKKSPWEGLQK